MKYQTLCIAVIVGTYSLISGLFMHSVGFRKGKKESIFREQEPMTSDIQTTESTNRFTIWVYDIKIAELDYAIGPKAMKLEIDQKYRIEVGTNVYRVIDGELLRVEKPWLDSEMAKALK